MLLPSSVSYSMRVPSLFFRIKATGKCREVGQPHPDGVHLQLDGQLPTTKVVGLHLTP